MKAEVLQKIKQTESEYEKMISEAIAESRRASANAELEADNLKEGVARAAELRQRGSRNLEKAALLLVSRFKEQLHVHS